MKNDVKTNIDVSYVGAAATVASAATNSTGVASKNYKSITFIGQVFTLTGTVTLTLEESVDNSTWAVSTTTSGNTLTSTVSAVGTAKIHVTNPTAAYYRAAATISNAATYALFAVAGPKKYVSE
jgi:hypothetical protein